VGWGEGRATCLEGGGGAAGNARRARGGWATAGWRHTVGGAAGDGNVAKSVERATLEAEADNGVMTRGCQSIQAPPFLQGVGRAPCHPSEGGMYHTEGLPPMPPRRLGSNGMRRQCR